MEFPLNFLQLLHSLCTIFPQFPCDLVMCHHLTMTHSPVTLVTLSYMILSRTPSLCSKSRKEKKRKEKKEKEKINNDLAVLPSHDTTPLLSFLVLRNSL